MTGLGLSPCPPRAPLTLRPSLGGSHSKRPLLFPSCSRQLSAIRLPALPLPRVSPPAGILAYLLRAQSACWSSSGSLEVGTGDYGDERAHYCPTHFTEKQTGVICPRPQSKLMVRHLPPHLVLPATGGPPQPWTPTWGTDTLTRTPRHPARSPPSFPAHSCSLSATPLSWEGRGRSVRGGTPPGPPWQGRGGPRDSPEPGLHQRGYRWGHPGPGPVHLQKACLVRVGCHHARGWRSENKAAGWRGKGRMTFKEGGSFTRGLAPVLTSPGP